MPHHMLPQTKHPTTFSVIHSENHTVLNVLVDVVILQVSCALLHKLSFLFILVVTCLVKFVLPAYPLPHILQLLMICFQGNVERQVLVQDYEVGKVVAFDPRISNVKEVYTLDGYKMLAAITFLAH